MALDALGAADGQFQKAIDAAERAIALAEKLDRQQLVDDIRNRLKLYLLHRPYYQT